MNKTLLILAFATALISCEKPKDLDKVHQNAEGEITVGKNFVVDKPLAILVLPTDESLEQTKKEIGSDNYRIYYDDGASIMNDANIVLEKNNIESIEKLNNEIITFHTNDGKLYDVNLTDKAFTTLLFNGKEAPKEMFSENLETDESITKYMQ
jgi:hypothetical protein